ncbi:hemerythrin family protein [Draconibacterium sp. IB214405]|uniref:bacteriohemerythrin n=1 Tax=Draconibacterium sp. IB214405 TaxID=3097352 RepID=UPI002A13BFFC|nr:hemerythrin family protein [Draconibacterium sp. IB214405]MDX8338744.1 hemerythrin family protein [Draconibacterium sp. IB214405]
MTLTKIRWSDKLSIGNRVMDNDHQSLIEIYNNLVDFMETNGNRNDFAAILSKMTDYSLAHFKKEEAYMEEIAYPELNKHIRLHGEYIYKIAMFNYDLLGANPPDPGDIIKFLEKWWQSHILSVDIKYEKLKKGKIIG